jgi:hypothetical protein
VCFDAQGRGFEVAAPLSLGCTDAQADTRPAALLFNQLFGEIFSLSLVLASAASMLEPGEAQGVLAGIHDLDGAVTDVRRTLGPPWAAGASGQAEVLRSLQHTVRSIAQRVETTSLSSSRRAAVWDQAFQVRAVLKEVARLSDPVQNPRWSSSSWHPVGQTAEVVAQAISRFEAGR